MEQITPEQLKVEKAERDAVLAELYLSKKENERLKIENNQLTPKVADLKQEEFIISSRITEKNRLLNDVGVIRSDIRNLEIIKKGLNDAILLIQNDPTILSLSGTKDKLQKDIGALETDKTNLIKINEEFGLSNADIAQQVHNSEGRLSELEKAEEKAKGTLSKEVADLAIQKSGLESDVEAKTKEVSVLGVHRDGLVETINTLTKIYDKVFEKANTIEGIVGSVKEISDKNLVDIRELFTEMGIQVRDVIDKTKESAVGADVILEKLPRWIFELQRPISLKRIPPRMINRVVPDKTNE